MFTCWTSAVDDEGDEPCGVISGYRLAGSTGWYWAALLDGAAPLLHVTDWHVARRPDPLLVKSHGLWAEHTCDDPLRQWTIVNETYATAFDDADEALGRAYGVPTALSWDLEWYATAEPRPASPAPGASDRSASEGSGQQRPASPDRGASDRSASGGSGQPRPAWPGNAIRGYQQSGVVHGTIEVGGRPPRHLAEAPAHRWHRWGDHLEAIALPAAYAHTGRRAPFTFPDGTSVDWVLTPDGWRSRPDRAVSR